MNLRLFGRTKEKIVAVADIGGGSAGFGVLALRHGAPAAVLAADRAILPAEERSEEAIIAGVGEMFIQAGKKVQSVYTRDWQNTKGPIEALYAIVHAPWTETRTVRATTTFKQETKITSNIITRLAQGALNQDNPIDRSKFLGANVMQIELNGYPTRHPEGKWAHEVAITGLVSECDTGMRTAIEACAGQLLPHITPMLRSSTRALLSILRDEIPQKKYIIADIASEATALIIAEAGAVSDQLVVSEGVRTIVRRLSPSGMLEETLSLLRMLEREHCDTEACETLRTSIASVEPELVRVFGEALGKLAATNRLPDHLVIATHPDISPWLTRFFSRIDFTQFTQTAQPFSIQALTAKDFEHFVLPERGVALDTGLAVSASLVSLEEAGE